MTTELNPKLRTLLLMAPKISGAYDSTAFTYIEEQLTLEESQAVEAFFTWLTANELAYGHGNLEARWKQWQAEMKTCPHSTRPRDFCMDCITEAENAAAQQQQELDAIGIQGVHRLGYSGTQEEIYRQAVDDCVKRIRQGNIKEIIERQLDLIAALRVAMAYIPKDGDAERDDYEACVDALRKAGVEP